LQQYVKVTKLTPPSFFSVKQSNMISTNSSVRLPSIPRDEPVTDIEAPIPAKLPQFAVYRPNVPQTVSTYYYPGKQCPHSPGRTRLNDYVRLYVRGGSGGQGSITYAGLGGDGGNVVIQCQQGASLQHFSLKQYRRVVGRHGGHFTQEKRKKKGIRGLDIVVPVPPGTTVSTDDGRILAEMNTVGSRVLVARGGQGGNPSREGWCGEKGKSQIIRLDLKLMADVGLVGYVLGGVQKTRCSLVNYTVSCRFPNAGKSTLLGELSRAAVRAGDFPFTTIRPSIGMMEYTDLFQVSVADLPGLVEGAHLNRGMGHKFLKHVEHTSILLLVVRHNLHHFSVFVDVNGFQLSNQHPRRTAFQSLCLLAKGVYPVHPCSLGEGVYPVHPCSLGEGVYPVHPCGLGEGVYPVHPCSLGEGVYPVHPCSLQSGRGGLPNTPMQSGRGGLPSTPMQSGRGGLPNTPMQSGRGGLPSTPMWSVRGGLPSTPMQSGRGGLPSTPMQSGRGGLPCTPMQSGRGGLPSTPMQSGRGGLPSTPMQSGRGGLPSTPMQSGRGGLPSTPMQSGRGGLPSTPMQSGRGGLPSTPMQSGRGGLPSTPMQSGRGGLPSTPMWSGRGGLPSTPMQSGRGGLPSTPIHPCSGRGGLPYPQYTHAVWEREHAMHAVWGEGSTQYTHAVWEREHAHAVWEREHTHAVWERGSTQYTQYTHAVWEREHTHAVWERGSTQYTHPCSLGEGTHPCSLGERVYPVHPCSLGEGTHPCSLGEGVYPVHPCSLGEGVYPVHPCSLGEGVYPVHPCSLGEGVYPTHPCSLGEGVYPVHP
ncbi:hypothetical protein QZH41_015256, partial [Actinostola sp. cb2023]